MRQQVKKLSRIYCKITLGPFLMLRRALLIWGTISIGFKIEIVLASYD
jgi:hypothetical protein